MENSTTFVYLIGYDRQFRQQCNTGFGCGYICIPVNHPIIKAWNKKIEEQDILRSQNPDEYYPYKLYLTIPEIEQEITYTEAETINGIDYIVAGFDTAHSYNDSSHDKNYVLSEILKIKELVDKYKGE